MPDAFTVLWTQDTCRALRGAGRAGECPPVAFSGVHTSLPAWSRARAGDEVYAVHVNKGAVFVVTRLRVLDRERGDCCGPASTSWDGPAFPGHGDWSMLGADGCGAEAVHVDATAVRFDTRIPGDLLAELTWRNLRGRIRGLKHVVDGRLEHSISLHGFYRLTPESAEELAKLVEATLRDADVLSERWVDRLSGVAGHGRRRHGGTKARRHGGTEARRGTSPGAGRHGSGSRAPPRPAVGPSEGRGRIRWRAVGTRTSWRTQTTTRTRPTPPDRSRASTRVPRNRRRSPRRRPPWRGAAAPRTPKTSPTTKPGRSGRTPTRTRTRRNRTTEHARNKQVRAAAVSPTDALLISDGGRRGGRQMAEPPPHEPGSARSGLGARKLQGRGGEARGLGVGGRASRPYTSMCEPMTTVRSRGSPKCSAASAVM